MNSTIKSVLEKICSDEHLLKEFAELQGEEIFDFLVSHSDQAFTKQEFEDYVAQVFLKLYGGAELSDEDVEAVAGGRKISTKKAAAVALAALSLSNVAPMVPEGLSLTPKASSFGWFRRHNLHVQNPWEMDEVIDFLRRDAYYGDRLRRYGAPVEDENAFRNWFQEGGNDSNGKRWWFMNDPSVSTPAAQDAVERVLEESLEAIGMDPVQRGLARGMVRQQAGNIRRAAANSASNNGSNIAGIHAQEGQVANMMDLANMQHSPDAVQAHPELAAVDRLLLKYFDCIATSNGVSVNDLNDDMAELLNSPAFGNLVGETFGCFNIVEQPTFFGIPTGGATRRVVNGVDRLKILLMKRGADQRTFERERFFSKMQRNAPILMTSLILSSRMGALAHAKDILIQAGAWVKAGVIKTYNRFVYNRLTLERDPVKLKELMTEYLKSSVFRQDAAMDRIVEIMSGMTDLWKQSDESGKPCNCACTMAFIGDSGIGKTHAARTLSKAIFHKDMQPWQFITSTSVTASTSAKDAKTGEGLAPADQLFNANSEIVRQLKLNNRVVVVLDEIDKMHKADPNDTILERLRDARDTGKLLVRNGVNYEYIDVSRTVFICITNELRQCWGLPPVQLTEAQAAARTNIQRDKSLVNRFDIVEFNNLKADDYAFILKPQLDELRKEYSQKYGIDINVSEKLVKDISNAAEVRNKGVRGVNDFLVLLRGKLVDYRSKHKPKAAAGKQAKVIKQRYKIGVEYSPEVGNFVLVN